MNSKSNHIEWVDTYRGFLFLFVIITHTYRVEEYHWIYDPFFLTGFFFISGIVYKKRCIKEDLYSILHGLFLPWLFLSIISISPYFLIEGVRSGLDRLYLGIIYGHSMWFICALMGIRVIHTVLNAILYERYLYSRYIVFIISFVSIFFLTYADENKGTRMIWNLDTAIWTYSYFLVGTFLKRKFFNNSSTSDKISLKSLLIITLLFLALYLQGLYGYAEIMDMCSNTVPKPLIFTISSFFSVIILMYAFRNGLNIRYFNNAGKYTLFAFAWHNWLIIASRKLWGGVIDAPEYNPYIIGDLSYILVQSVLFLYLLNIIAHNANKHFPCFVGKNIYETYRRVKYRINAFLHY